MTRPRIGLALGGGAAHGMAHVGVLEALEHAGIPIDVISGTSAGSIIGAFYAAGWRIEQMHELALKIGWRPISRPAWPWQGGWISFAPLEHFVARQLDDPLFEHLKIPFAAMTTDGVTGDPVMLTRGRVACAVHASSAVPGVAVPVEIEGRLLMDGGVSDNLPVRAARFLGADYVIASSIFGRHYILGKNVISRGVAAVENAVRWAGGGLLMADCVIESDISRYNYVTFRGRAHQIEAGRLAAEAQVASIRAAIGLGG